MAKLKICGVRTKEEAQELFRLGTDYIGLLVEVEGTELSISRMQAKEIRLAVGEKPVVILTNYNNPQEIIWLAREINPWGIQLIDSTPRLYKKLASSLPIDIPTRIIPSFAVTEQTAGLLSQYHRLEYFVIDTRIESRSGGGTGKTHDWAISRNIAMQYPNSAFLAGGLNADNIEGAIRAVNPYAIDIQSSLKDENGIINFLKVNRLLQELREINNYLSRGNIK